LAGSFAEDGKFDEAVGAYRAVIERGKFADRLTARLSLAKLLLDDGQDSAAGRQLDAYLIEAPASVPVRDAQLLMAETLRDEGRYSESLPLYDAYLQQDGPANQYAELGRAEALAAQGDPAASGAGEAVLSQGLPTSTRLGFITTMAQLLQNKQPQQALHWYQRLLSESSAPSDDAFALWQSAEIEGTLSAKLDAWQTIIKRYPNTATAAEIVDSPPGGDTTLDFEFDPYYTGLVHYLAGDASSARTEFLQSLSNNRIGDGTALAARAQFYLAVLDERSDSIDAAIRRYDDVLNIDPSVDLADDALWWEGRLYEQERQPSAAVEAYKRIISNYGGSGYVAEANFRIGLISYDAQKFDDAAQTFSLLAKASKDDDKRRAQLWQGKALAEAGDDAGAKSVWESLQSDDPDGYYGLRAAVLLGEGQGKLKDASLAAKQPDWAAIETWLKNSGAGEPAAARQALATNPHWDTGRALLALGMEHRASAEFDAVLDSSLGDPNMLYELSRQFYQIGVYDESSRAATRLLAHVPDELAETAPEDLWKLAYPAPYADAFRDASNESDVSSVLMLALVRQESFFDPLAGSSAGAIGLTQVVGPTGDQIAGDLDISDFKSDDLFRPALSLRFGAHYLQQQLDLFNGNFYEALAAYNAGPGNAQRWAKVSSGDVDRFVAEIEFSQTEAYVTLVSENLARYRELYQGLAAPALPKD
jgi:soluble lytic murein transglycosylase